jgi:hypothetical protein
MYVPNVPIDTIQRRKKNCASFFVLIWEIQNITLKNHSLLALGIWKKKKKAFTLVQDLGMKFWLKLDPIMKVIGKVRRLGGARMASFGIIIIIGHQMRN